MQHSAVGNLTRQVYYYEGCGGVSKPFNVVFSWNGLSIL